MSLMKTLAKVAIGVAVAKGAKSMMGGGQSRQAQRSDDGLFGGAHSPDRQVAQGGSGLEGMMDSILGGGNSSSAGQQSGASGGLGGLLEQLGGGSDNSTTASSGGGLGGLLGGLAGAGGLGGLLGGLAGQTQGSDAIKEPEGSFGDVFNSQFDSNPAQAKQATPDQEAAAGLMLSAMIQAAKSDGKLDDGERAKLMEKLGDVDAQERAFVQAEMQKPVDVNQLASQTPKGLEAQVYLMSILGIDLDTNEEARYLDQLRDALGLSKDQANMIHDKMGVPKLYS